MDTPHDWPALVKLFSQWEWEDDTFDPYDKKTQRQAVSKLSAVELAEALNDVMGCGCCCSLGASSLRHAVKARIKDLLCSIREEES